MVYYGIYYDYIFVMLLEVRFQSIKILATEHMIKCLRLGMMKKLFSEEHKLLAAGGLYKLCFYLSSEVRMVYDSPRSVGLQCSSSFIFLLQPVVEI